MTRRTQLSLAALILAAAAARAEVQWTPFLTAELYGGQSFFSGDSNSPVSGPNGSILFIPAMRLNEKTSLFPSFALDFRKTQDVQELVGGGFLTQEESNQAVSIKAIRALAPGWKGKLMAGFKQQLVKETTDEKWGQGLFDYRRFNAGTEIEKEGVLWRSLRLGLNYYRTEFPNFQSLAGAGADFGAEINSGKDVLDYDSLDLSFSGDVFTGGKTSVSFALLASQRGFGDQNLVRSNGSYSDTLRRDLYLFGSAAGRLQLPTVAIFHSALETVVGLDASYANLNSNQNNYDTSSSTQSFNPDYYDYTEINLGPRASFRLHEKLTMGVSVMWTRRDYGKRPVQAVDGSYQSGTILNDTWTYRLSFGYPLTDHLAAVAQGAYQTADSNMKYETIYRYNYTSSNFFLGISYKL